MDICSSKSRTLAKQGILYDSNLAVELDTSQVELKLGMNSNMHKFLSTF